MTGTSNTYDWYFNSYNRLHPLFSSVFKTPSPNPTVLDVGCGNSTLLSSLVSNSVAERGIGIDISKSVIAQCSQNLEPNTPLKFVAHDLTSPVPDDVIKTSSLSFAVDKGTLDAILSGGTDADKSTAAINDAAFVILNVLR